MAGLPVFFTIDADGPWINWGATIHSAGSIDEARHRAQEAIGSRVFPVVDLLPGSFRGCWMRYYGTVDPEFMSGVANRLGMDLSDLEVIGPVSTPNGPAWEVTPIVTIYVPQF